MAKQNIPLYSFNKGEISRFALGRLDAEQLRLAAETQVNWVPMTLGPMMFRPGLKYLGSVNNNGFSVIRPFVFAVNDTAILELSDETLRVWVDDELLEANSVSTTVTNGDMSSSTGWTLEASEGAVATISGNALTLNIEAKGSSAYAEQAVPVVVADLGVEHRLRITVTRGPVAFSIGSGSGSSDVFASSALGTGVHSIAFTPTAAFYIRFTALNMFNTVIASVQVESAGALELPTPWTEADLRSVRYVQSGDIVFCAQENYQQRQIERRDNNSWSVVLHEPIGGPYQSQPEWAQNIYMVVDSGQDTGTMTASEPFFTEADVNSIICIDRAGVEFTQNLAAERTFTDAIEVNGSTSEDRVFDTFVTGTWVGLVSLYRSVLGPDEGFANAGVNTSINISDQPYDDSATHANRAVWYRWGFTTYTSGVAVVKIEYLAGPLARGQARIIGYNSPTSVAIEKFDRFPDVATDSERGTFRIADWSDTFGWPSAVEIHDGRLWWGGRDKVWGSISDDYINHEETFEGDAGPINRSFGSGPFANISWLCSLNRLIAGRDNSCVSIRSSNFDAPLTPTDFTMKDSTSHGSAQIAAIKIDKSAVYVDKSSRRVYELRYDIDTQDYTAFDLTALNPDIGLETFVDMAVQRQLDTRVHLVRGDGQAAVLSYERNKVEAWWRVETDGEIEAVCVLPGQLEDAVYYVVKRTINGSTVRYLEKFARQDECVGGTLNHQADSYKAVSQSSSTTITGLSHLEGETVIVWANGKDLGDYVVASGQITVSEAVTTAIVGLEYEGRFKSSKLAYAAQAGTALMQKKRAVQLGLLLADTHYQGLEIGQDFDTMDPLPAVEENTATDANTVWEAFDAPMIPIPGRWQTDARLCLRATAPRPATVIAAAIDVQTYEKV
jgi:hypothetical protein